RDPRYYYGLLFLSISSSALSFALQWSVRHDLSQVDVGRFLFGSMFLPAASFALALAYAFDGRHTLLMAFLAMALLSAILVTATRSAVILLIPIAMTLAVAHGHRRWRLAGLVTGFGIFILIVVTFISVT